DLRQAFVSAARGRYRIMLDDREIGEEVHRRIEVEGHDREALLVQWLNELIYTFDVENLVFKSFHILEMTDTGLKVDCFGQKLDPEVHEVRLGVKAATYHMLKVEEGNGFRAQVLFDI
ncbi:MAG: archease, partial [Chloroflexi bacterium]|nr:archease [Chloroflexota bacterium]